MENQNQPLSIVNEEIQLPNTTAVLVLGICSIVFCCLSIIATFLLDRFFDGSILFGSFFIAPILGITGIIHSTAGRRMYKKNPGIYNGYKQLDIGYGLSIIGTILSLLFIAIVIFLARVFSGGFPGTC